MPDSIVRRAGQSSKCGRLFGPSQRKRRKKTLIYGLNKGGERSLCETTLDDFLVGGQVEIVPYNDKDCLPPEEVIERAKGALGQGAYDLVRRNCEQFATWCKTGQSKSKQVAEKSPLVGGLFNLGTWVAAAFIGGPLGLALRGFGTLAFMGSCLDEGEGSGF